MKLRAAVTALVTVSLLAAGPAGCGGRAGQEQLAGQKVPGTAVTVAIVDSPETVGTFQPRVAHIKAGQSVGWINAGGNYHTVTFAVPNAPPSSQGFGHGATFTATFQRPGDYRYRCIYHTGMQGEVIVAATTAASPPPGR
jgi:plastocyanin